MKYIASAALLSALLVSPSLAETLTKTVLANRTTVLGGINLFNQMNCSHAGIPKLSLKSAPKHGKVSFKPNTVQITKGRCKGKKIPGMQIVYSPKRGYRGKDDFHFQMSYNRHVTGTMARSYVSYNVKLTVK